MSGSPESIGGLATFLPSSYIETLGIAPALTLLMFLTFIVHIDRYMRMDLKKTMRIIILVIFSLVVQNFLEYRFTKAETRWLARTLTAVYGYAIRPVILILFLRVIAPQKRLGWAWILAGINTAVNATALFSHICFWIDENNNFMRGPLGWMCLYVSAILLVYFFIMTIRVFEPQERQETWIPVLATALIVGGWAMDNNIGRTLQPISYLTISIVIGSVAYYIFMHLQFVREHEQALQAEQRIQIMMTQIQPHFLYNTIATIRALCRRDADKAGEVAEKFGDYLRQNLDSLNIVGLIPFEKELEHTKIYAEIEMVRFDNIRVEYDIEDTHFNLPPLTLQPLVENAIRHGVRIREEGVVRVLTRNGEKAHEVIVSDNGTGFDVSKINSTDGSHIGIRNVKERIERMCGGTLSIESVMGEGTTVKVTIPAVGEVKP